MQLINVNYPTFLINTYLALQYEEKFQLNFVPFHIRKVFFEYVHAFL